MTTGKKTQPKWLHTKDDGSQVIREGSVEIPLNEFVFYNPIQEFNRDLSIAAISAWHLMDLMEQDKKAAALGKKDEPRQDLESKANESKELNDKPDVVGEPKGYASQLQYLLKKRGAVAPTVDPESRPDKSYTILEALSASGLRSIRYSKELKNVKKIIANDMDNSAIEAIESNIEYNQVGAIVEPKHSNAIHAMWEAIMSNTKYHVIDLDPYGSAVPFLDAAVQAVSEGGLLCVTCTDMAVLAGSQSEACWHKYGGSSLPGSAFCHELGLRILLQCLQMTAVKHKKVIEPLMSCSIDFYARVFVRVRTSAAEVKAAASKSSLAYHCAGCKNFVLQPLGRMTITSTPKGGVSSKFGPAKGPTGTPFCEHCGSISHIGGPFYNGPIHKKEFIDVLLLLISKATKEQYGTLDRMAGMVGLISEELDVPFYHSLPALSNVMHSTTPPIDAISSALVNGGYKISETHACQNALKTDAPFSFLLDVMKTWVSQNRPIAEKNLKPESPAYKLFHLPLSAQSETISFKTNPHARGLIKKFKMTRFQENPTENWGPKARPSTRPPSKKRKAEDTE